MKNRGLRPVIIEQVVRQAILVTAILHIFCTERISKTT